MSNSVMSVDTDSPRPLQSKTNPQDVHEGLSGLKFADKSQCKKIIIK